MKHISKIHVGGGFSVFLEFEYGIQSSTKALSGRFLTVVLDLRRGLRELHF